MKFAIHSSALALTLLVATLAPAQAGVTVWTLFEDDAGWSSRLSGDGREAATGESHFLPKIDLAPGELAWAECIVIRSGVGRWTIERKHGARIETKSLGIAPCDAAPNWAPVTPD